MHSDTQYHKMNHDRDERESPRRYAVSLFARWLAGTIIVARGNARSDTGSSSFPPEGALELLLEMVAVREEDLVREAVVLRVLEGEGVREGVLDLGLPVANSQRVPRP